MYEINKPFHNIEGCEIIYKNAPWFGSEVIAELYEAGKFKFSIRVTERYDGRKLTHEQVIQELEMKLLQKRLEDEELIDV